MNFQTMDYFAELAASQSFTAAAARLNVTQQTLSASIAHAEKELGVQLVIRSNPLRLTFAGEQFLSYANKMRAERRAMYQEFLDIAQEERGKLRVGVTATRGHIIMPRAIAAFQSAHPHIVIELVEGENDELLDLLSQGTIDMMVGTVHNNPPQLEVHTLVQERVILLVQQALLERLYGDRAISIMTEVRSTQSLRPLSGCPFMLIGQRDVAGSLARAAFERSGVIPQIKVISKNSETLIALALRGVGACFLTSEVIATTFPDPSAAGMVTADLGSSMAYQIHVSWRRTDHVWSAIRAFYQVLSDQFADGSRLTSVG